MIRMSQLMDLLICSVQVYFQDYIQSSENKKNTFRIEQSN